MVAVFVWRRHHIRHATCAHRTASGARHERIRRERLLDSRNLTLDQSCGATTYVVVLAGQIQISNRSHVDERSQWSHPCAQQTWPEPSWMGTPALRFPYAPSSHPTRKSEADNLPAGPMSINGPGIRATRPSLLRLRVFLIFSKHLSPSSKLACYFPAALSALRIKTFVLSETIPARAFIGTEPERISP